MMNQKNKKLIFPADTHDIVMIVRTTIELIVFVIFVFLSSKIFWLRKFPQLEGLKIGVSAAFSFSIVFLIWVIYKKFQGKSTKNVINLEAIGDAVLIIWLIFIFGGMNGPFFFFFFLSLMETAFTLNLGAILIVAIMGIFSLIGDYIFGVTRGVSVLDIQSLFFLFFRLVSISLIAYYGYSFAKSIGRERKAIVRARDLTEDLEKAKSEIEKAYEVEKEAHKELKRLDEAKSQFVLATQHHLRTPLTSMYGYLDLLLEGRYGKVPEKIKEILGRFQKSTKNEIKIVNELLNVSQFQMGGQVVLLEPNIGIESILKEIIEEIKPEAENKGIYLKMEEFSDIPEIQADPQKLKIALFNIVDNAVKYSDKGGVTVKCQISDNKLQIMIKDTGMGITKGEAKELFNRLFERGEKAKKLYTTGRGIGLFIASHIIKAHQGKIWVESEGLGKGSTFYIELPVE